MKFFLWVTSEIPQGLFLDKENNFILETWNMGLWGGDEINLIETLIILKFQIMAGQLLAAEKHYTGKRKVIKTNLKSQTN